MREGITRRGTGHSAERTGEAARRRGALYRRVIFMVGAGGLGALLVWSITGLPPFGEHQGSYGLILNNVAPTERHAANVVSAINYDYRALDTLGEEFILFAAVTAVALLLRLSRQERTERVPEPRTIDEALIVTGPATVAITVLFGVYVMTHGQLTPGGGFQGGVIVATGIFLLYLVSGYEAFRRLTPRAGVEIIEAAGTGGYIIVGALGLFLGDAFLQNLLPIGEFRSLLSGGTIPLISLLVGLAVAGGFTSLYLEFLEVAVETAQEDGEEIVTAQARPAGPVEGQR